MSQGKAVLTGLAILGVVVAGGTWGRIKKSSLNVVCDRERFDFGTVEGYEAPELTCTVSNRSGRRVFLQVDADCRCVNIDPKMAEIPASGSQQVRVQLRSEAFAEKRGPYELVDSDVAVHLRSSAGAKSFVLPVSAQRFAPVSLAQKPASWVVPVGARNKHTVRFSVDPAFEPVRVQSHPSFVKSATLHWDEKNRRGQLQFVSLAEALGRVAGNVQLQLLSTSDANSQRAVTVPVRLSVNGVAPVRLSPRVVFAGDLRPNEPLRIIARTAAKAFTVVGIAPHRIPTGLRATSVGVPNAVNVYSHPASTSLDRVANNDSHQKNLEPLIFSVKVKRRNGSDSVVHKVSIPVL